MWGKFPEPQVGNLDRPGLEFRRNLHKAAAILDIHAIWRRKDGVRLVAGVADAARLEAENFRFLIRAGAMLPSTRHHDAFAASQADTVFAEFDTERSLPDQEKFIGVVMD